MKLQKVIVFLCYYGLKFSQSVRQSVRRRMDRLSASQILGFYPYFVWYTIIKSIKMFGTKLKNRCYFSNTYRLICHMNFSASPCINYMQYLWGYAVPVRICITRESYHQYPWVISVSQILSTGEDMQCPWVISSVPVSHILSTGEDMQCPWVISSVPLSYPQYP